MNCSDLWAAQPLQQSYVLFSSLLRFYLLCPDSCYGTNQAEAMGTSGFNASSLACPNILGVILVVGENADKRIFSQDSFAPSPCTSRIQCTGSWCAGLLDLDVIASSGQIIGDPPLPLALIVSLSSPTEAYTILSTRSTPEYALSSSDTLTISGVTAPELVQGENTILFRLILLNPSISTGSASVSVLAASGVIQGVGVSAHTL